VDVSLESNFGGSLAYHTYFGLENCRLRAVTLNTYGRTYPQWKRGTNGRRGSERKNRERDRWIYLSRLLEANLEEFSHVMLALFWSTRCLRLSP
jgi:hypothetical protein